MLSISNAYDDGLRDGLIQTLEYLLPQLPYRSLGEAIWALRELKDDMVVQWILEYCQPTIVAYENIDVESPGGSEALAYIREGEIIALIGQDSPIDNGVYVYTGDTTPLLK